MLTAWKQKLRAPLKMNHYPGYHLEKLTALRVALYSNKEKFDLNL